MAIKKGFIHFPLSISSQWKRRGCAGLVLSFAILMGIIANQISGTTAITQWGQLHRPSPQFIRSFIKTQHLSELRDQRLKASIVRTIVRSEGERYPESGIIWVSSDMNWVYFEYSTSQGSGDHLYCRACRKSRTVVQWRMLPAGWEVVEELNALFLEEKRGLPQNNRGGIVSADPRELFY